MYLGEKKRKKKKRWSKEPADSLSNAPSQNCIPWTVCLVVMYVVGSLASAKEERNKDRKRDSFVSMYNFTGGLKGGTC